MAQRTPPKPPPVRGPAAVLELAKLWISLVRTAAAGLGPALAAEFWGAVERISASWDPLVWLDAVLDFLDNVMTMPFTRFPDAAEELVSKAVGRNGGRARAMSTENAGRAAARAMMKPVRDAADLWIDWNIANRAAVVIGRFVWRAFKRMTGVLSILGITSEEAAIAWIERTIAKRAVKFGRLFALVFIFFVLVIIHWGIAWGGCFFLIYNSEVFETLSFNQNSKRTYADAHKRNRLRGTATPSPPTLSE